MAIATAYVDIKPDMRGIHKETKKGLQGVGAEFDAEGKRSGGRFSGAVGKVAKAGLVGAGVAAAAGLGTALTKGFSRLTAIDNAEAKLRGLGHSAETVEQIMENSLNSVKGTAFGLEEAATVSAQLVASGIKPGKELESTLKTVADSATIAGIGMDEMGAIFGKVAANGKLQGDELNQLSERGIPALQLLSDHLGKSTEDVRKMVSEGKIDFETFSAAMEDGMGGAALKSGETFEGAWKNVGAAMGRIGATLLTPIFEAAKGGMVRLTEILDGVNSAIQGVFGILLEGDYKSVWSDAFGIHEDAPIIDFLFRVRDAFIGIWDLVVNGDFGSHLRNAFGIEEDSALVSLVLGFRDGIKELWDQVKGIAPSLGDLWANLSPLGAAFKILEPSLPILAQAFGTIAGTVGGVLVGAIKAILPLWGQILSVMGEVFFNILSAVIPIIETLANMLGPILTVVLQALAPIIQVVIDVFSTLVQALMPIVGIVLGLIQTLLPPLMGLFTALAPIIQFVGTVVGFLAKVIGTILVAAINFLMPIIRFLVQVLSVVLVAAIKIVTAIFNGLVWVVKNILAPIFTWLWKNIIVPVWNGIKDAVLNAWNKYIKPAWDAIVRFVKDWLAPRFEILKKVITLAWAIIRRKIMEAWRDHIKPIFDKIVAFIRDVLAPKFESFKGTIQRVWNAIKDKIRDTWYWIRNNVFDPLKKVIKETLPAAFRKGRDAIGKAWNGLRALARKPVAFVVETIIRDGLVKPFNNVAGVFGAKTIDEKKFTVPKLATGGKVPGYSPTSTADNIPIWATAGEFMVRRKSSDRLRRNHPGLLEHINKFGDVPAYANGGIVALGHALQAIGVRVSEHSKFGGVNPVHSKNSWHYRDGALDLNTAPGQSAGEMAFFDLLMPVLARMGWGTIWRYPNHLGHAHVDIGGKKLGNFPTAKGSGFGGKLSDALDGLKNFAGGVGDAIVDLNPFKGLVDKIKNGIGKDPFAQMIGKGATNLVNTAVDWMQAKMPFGGDTGDIKDPGGQGGGVGRWADTVRKALTMLGQPTNDAMVNTVLRRMKQESGGNPRAINNWDSNAARGVPSKGLMQVIGPTFKAYAMKGFNRDIYDPLSNILASMRYALARYGSLSKAYNRKGGYAEGGTITPTLYDSGGWLQPGFTTVLNATGKPEAVFTQDQLAMLSGGNNGPTIEINFNGRVDDPNQVVQDLRYEMNRFFTGGKYGR